MLCVRDISKKFGGVVALDSLSFEVAAGEIVGLIGPNGSGKTTCINTISGLFAPTSGDVFLGGKSLTSLPVHRVVRMGVGRTFQNLRLLHELSVLDNVRVAQNAHINSVLAWCGLGGRQHEATLRKQAERLLESVGLHGRRDELAGNLSYGQQKRLEIARALATHPQFLLMDEPAGGMNASDIDDLKQLMRAMQTDGVGLLLVEHNMGFVMDICERIVVLNFGRKIAQGSPEEVRNHPDVIDAYLGRSS